MSFNKNKDYENMSVKELLAEVNKVHKKTKFQVPKLRTDEQGNVLLNPKNKSDKEWYENDKDYDVL